MDEAAKRKQLWNRLSFVIMGIGVTTMLAAAVLVWLTLSGRIGDDGNSVPETITGFNDLNDVLTPAPTATVPAPPASTAPIGRLVIPRFGVEAPVIILGVDANGVMEAPDNPIDVAWYDFSGRPGLGPTNSDDGQQCCNAVFSGHVDYFNYGPAVFYSIGQLDIFDSVEVRMDDGTVYHYAVISKDQVYASTADVQSIVGPTPNEIITMITCGGNFDGAQYDQRVIVRAQRVEPPAVTAP